RTQITCDRADTFRQHHRRSAMQQAELKEEIYFAWRLGVH
ncbi:hypothetical protein GFK32_15780, partial [Salmonella enterica subsp. enterica serovar Enteritidis]|nr:hypothetical protein [Salmonella enterica subsp. enterica serovar Enteritidis]